MQQLPTRYRRVYLADGKFTIECGTVSFHKTATFATGLSGGDAGRIVAALNAQHERAEPLAKLFHSGDGEAPGYANGGPLFSTAWEADDYAREQRQNKLNVARLDLVEAAKSIMASVRLRHPHTTFENGAAYLVGGTSLLRLELALKALADVSK